MIQMHRLFHLDIPIHLSLPILLLFLHDNCSVHQLLTCILRLRLQELLFLLVLIEVPLEIRDAMLGELFGAEMVEVADVAADHAPAGAAHDDHVGVFFLCKLPTPVVQVEQSHRPFRAAVSSRLELGDQSYIVSTGDDTYPSCNFNITNSYHHGRSMQ